MKYMLLCVLLAGCATSNVDKQHDAALITPEAPWLYKDFVTKEQQEQLSLHVCSARIDTLPRPAQQECWGKLRDMLHARWHTAYYMVPWNEFEDRCKAFPDGCLNWPAVEAKLREVHNWHVENSRNNAHAAEPASPGWAAFLGGAAAATRPATAAPTHCNSQRGAYGNVVTDCQ